MVGLHIINSLFILLIYILMKVKILLESEHLIELEKGFKEADRILEEGAKSKQKVL